ncbi:hypothetical protein SAMN06265380_1141, partial [Ruegeria faecimaris]
GGGDEIVRRIVSDLTVETKKARPKRGGLFLFGMHLYFWD